MEEIDYICRGISVVAIIACIVYCIRELRKDQKELEEWGKEDKK